MVKRLLLILNIFALVFGALATQSCEDTSGEHQHYQHGYNNRNYDNGNENYNAHPYNNSRYNRGSYPSDGPSIDVHY
jgi:hypothetical protein